MEKLSKGIRDFNQVAREIDAAYHLAAKQIGLSDSQRDILYILCQEQASQADICNMTGLSKQTVNSSVQHMVRDGYLQPLSGEKNEKLKLTETGSAFAERTIAKLIHAENAVFSSWSEENRELFITLNRNYLEAFLEELRKM